MIFPGDGKDYKIDHIGIAVESLEEGSSFYRALGYKDKDLISEVVESEKVRVAMIEMANNSRIELLEPTSSESPIAKFLQKRGKGIHHIALRVNDIENLLVELKAKGVRLINEEPKQGAHNCMIAFVHPSSAGGVLVELSEKIEGAE